MNEFVKQFQSKLIADLEQIFALLTLLPGSCRTIMDMVAKYFPNDVNECPVEE